MRLDLGIMAGAESKAWLADFKAQVDRLEKILGKKTLAEVTEEDEDDDSGEFETAKLPNAKKAKKVVAAAPDEDDEVDEDEKTEVDIEEDDDDSDEDDEEKANDDVDEDEDDEKETPEDEDEEDEGFNVAPPVKVKKGRGRPKKITIDTVNDACKARALAGGKNGRAQVLAILKKKFKTEGVSQLDPSQYEACIAAMVVDQ